MLPNAAKRFVAGWYKTRFSGCYAYYLMILGQRMLAFECFIFANDNWTRIFSVGSNDNAVDNDLMVTMSMMMMTIVFFFDDDYTYADNDDDNTRDDAMRMVMMVMAFYSVTRELLLLIIQIFKISIFWI